MDQPRSETVLNKLSFVFQKSLSEINSSKTVLEAELSSSKRAPGRQGQQNSLLNS